MRDEQLDLAAAEALGRTTQEELALLEDATAGDPALGRELGAYRATVTALESGVAREAPSADLLDRIMAEIQEPAAQPAAEPEPARAQASRGWFGRLRWPRVAFGAAAAAAAAVVIGVLALSGDTTEPDARAAIAGQDGFAAVSGEAEVFDTAEPGGTLVVRMRSVPPAPGGHHYEVWVLREGSEAMESVGKVAPSDGEAELEVSLPGAGPFAAVDVSVEPDDGDPEHSGRSLAGGTFN
jgi:anti-sigma-K factor RskA